MDGCTFRQYEIDLALQASDGNRAHAEKALGLAPTSLHKVIAGSKFLRSRWIDTTDIPEPIPEPEGFQEWKAARLKEQIRKVGPVDAVSNTDERTDVLSPYVKTTRATAVRKQLSTDSEFVQNLGALGVSDERQQFVLNLTKLQANHSSRVLDFVGGSLTVTAVTLMESIRNVGDTLAKLVVVPGDEVSMTRERNLHESLNRYVENLTAISSQLTENELTKAKVKESIAKAQSLLKGGAGGGGKGKPGFTPLAAQKTEVHVHGATSVKVSHQEAPPNEPVDEDQDSDDA